MNKLMCACGKHEKELQKMLEINEPLFKLTRELLKEQAEEIFGTLEVKAAFYSKHPTYREIVNLKKKYVGDGNVK